MPESSRQNTACGGLAYTIETSLTGIWSLPRASTSEPASAKPTIALLAPTCRMASTDRSLAAHDLHVEIGVLVIAFLDRDEEIGVTASRAFAHSGINSKEKSVNTPKAIARLSSPCM